MNNFDITGKQFGYLTVIERDYSATDKRNSKWICKCKCGNVTSVYRCFLISGHTQSCGCKRYDRHNNVNGLSTSHIYSVWSSMNARCNSTKKKNFNYYKGKGIIVCEEWKNSFLSFYDWSMAHGYSVGMSIDRIDNSKGYYPENCRWVNLSDQQWNKSNNVKIIYNGETQSLAKVCADIGFPRGTAYRRYQRLKAKGKEIDVDYLFAPIEEKKIAKIYRNNYFLDRSQ